jgi:hypothetical protein
VCGGCDTIQPFASILPMIEEVMGMKSPSLLVYEGLLISHSIGTIGELVKPYGDRHVMGFLDTPLEICLDRVKNRRLERGQLAPLNPENTTKDHASVARCHARASQQGFNTVSINHENAIEQSLGILHGLSEVVNAAHMDSRTGGNPHPKGCADASPAVD